MSFFLKTNFWRKILEVDDERESQNYDFPKRS